MLIFQLYLNIYHHIFLPKAAAFSSVFFFSLFLLTAIAQPEGNGEEQTNHLPRLTYILSTSALTKAQLKRGSSGNFTVFSSYLFLPNTSLKIYWHKIAINLLHSWFLWVTDCNSAQWALLVSHSALSCLWLKLGRPEWQLQ